MKIKKITIKNYRLLKCATLDLEDDLSLIIGKNNTGKTSFISLVKKFLSNKNTFSFNDFNLDFQEEIIEVIKKKLDNPEEYNDLKILMKIIIEYDENDSLKNLSEFLIDLSEDNNKVILQFEYTLDFEKYLELVKDYDLFNTKTAKSEQEFLSEFVGNYFRCIKKSVDLDGSNEIIIGDVSKVLDVEYISAQREVESNDANGNSDKNLSKLAYRYFDTMKELEKFEISELKKELYETDKALNPKYETTFEKLIKSITRFNTDSKIKITSNIAEGNIIQNNTNVIYEVGTTSLPEDYNGLGYMNLLSILFQIHIALDRLKRDNNETKKSDINLLFVEEPEVHTHPQMQYIFIKNIKALIEEYKKEMNLQTVITTHSSHIVSQSDFNDIKYFRKDTDGLIEIKNLKDLSSLYQKEGKEDKEAFNFIKQYLTINRAELFFADKAILIEGDTERILMPTIMKKIDNKNLEEKGYIPLLSQNISIIEVGAYSHIFAPLIKFLGIKTLIITDIDSVNKDDARCKVSEGINSCNSSIKYFLNTNDLGELKKSHIHTLNIQDESFKKDDNGYITLTYQNQIADYYPRTFEDAFYVQNKDFINENKDKFESLKKNFDDTLDPYDFPEKIYKKTAFALDVLFYSTEDLHKWEIPKYIKDGLEWIAKK
ncbi:MAG: ATP-dependent endonuclease [Clostridia bacterium]|nr:ATP-dependent endonuclease [Clostridia bacterium]